MTQAAAVTITDANSISDEQLHDWMQLFAAVPNATFYQHPHWLLSVSKSLSPGELRFAFISDKDKLKLVLPLCDSRGPKRPAHPTHDHLSLNDVLTHPDCWEPSELFNNIALALGDAGADWWDWLITNVPEHSPLIKALRKVDHDIDRLVSGYSNPNTLDTTLRYSTCNKDDNRWLLRHARSSAYFDCTSENCPPHGKLRRNLKRLRTQLEKDSAVRTEFITDSTLINQAFEEFLTVEASGWKSQGNASSIASDDALTSFYRSVLNTNTSNVHAHMVGAQDEDLVAFEPQINLLWCDDICAAAQFGVRIGKKLNLLKIGYDERYSRFSPGYLLLQALLADAQAKGIETVSLVTSPEWANRWHPEQQSVWHINRYNNTTTGSFFYHLDKFKQVAKTQIRKAA